MGWRCSRRKTLFCAVLHVRGVKQIVERYIDGVRVTKIIIPVGVSETLCVDKRGYFVGLCRAVCCQVLIKTANHDLRGTGRGRWRRANANFAKIAANCFTLNRSVSSDVFRRE